MQFVMKDASIIEIAYSPYVDTYIDLRSEILDVLFNSYLSQLVLSRTQEPTQIQFEFRLLFPSLIKSSL